MGKRYYKFAGITVEINMPDALFSKHEFALEPFRSDCSGNVHHFYFQKREQLTPPTEQLLTNQQNYFVVGNEDVSIRYIGAGIEMWTKCYIRAEHRGTEHNIQLWEKTVPGIVSGKVILESLSAEHLIAGNNGFVFHCSYIENNGKAILFTAPSGTGKSTQAELWKKFRGAEIINGDRAAVRLVDGVLMAEGIPFSGSSEYCKNRSLPIEAIVYLGQAPVTTVRKIHGYEAFSRIWEGVSVNIWDKKDMELVSDVVRKVAEDISVYYLACTPDETAVIMLEEELRKQVSL